MPAYNYDCPNCDWQGEKLQVAFENRGRQRCPECKKGLGKPVPAFGAIGDEPYQMKAVLGNGQHIKGHFGKEAKRNKKDPRKKK